MFPITTCITRDEGRIVHEEIRFGHVFQDFDGCIPMVCRAGERVDDDVTKHSVVGVVYTDIDAACKGEDKGMQGKC